ncbi:hypothetical protein [Brevundimonas sp. Root1279]|uniref:hypothetical protein n=1 Tax=Brevundimonas sp. Root1279 TaxID=1736443 RepID=UPI0006FF0ADB|nr:hypothetical protein [Brevundimonas sp. Root1279]KQW86467.1 hypothetical protein ASC65_00765 [Brevundimonas sp. Root1279]
MRLLVLSIAALTLAAASPALAGGPRGGHTPPPGPCCGHGGHGGGGSTNINVNVNARASAAASSQSYLNARTYEAGSYRSGGSYGGSVYVGGGYGGDAGGYGYVGTPVYYDIDPRALACASAPFGYVVTGFGREGRRAPSCGGRYEYWESEDRGGRYGYSERHESYEESRFESYEAYESREEFEAYGEYEIRHEREAAPYPPAYLPEPPRAEPPPRVRERRPAPPRQEYRQEPGERG